MAPSFSTRYFSAARLLFPTLFCFTILASASNSTCYYPDGLQSRGSACDPSADVSICCGPGFVCLSNGLCMPGPDDRKHYDYKYYRSGCTDPTWDSPICPQLCLGPNDSIDSGQGIQSCSDGPSHYCCADSQSENCCSNSTNIFTLGLADIVTTIPYISSLASATATPTTSLVTGGPLDHSSNNGGGVSKAVCIGVGVGVGVCGIFAILLGVILFLRYRRRRAAAGQSRSRTVEMGQGGAGRGTGDGAGHDTVKDTGLFAMREGDGARAHVPSDPQELEHSQRFELGVLPDHDELTLENRGEGEGNKYPGRYFKEEGVHRHEVAG